MSNVRLGNDMERQMESSATVAQSTPKGAWKITVLLLFYMVVNFADKIVVGLAGVPIMTELKLTPAQFGFLGSAFFFLFSIASILVGFLLNRFTARWVALSLALVWALVQFPMVWETSFATLVVCRIILGAAEGPAIAVALHAVFKWFPDEKRTLPAALINQGSAFGVILAVPILNTLIVNHSWHAAFGALGIVGLIWVALWLWLGEEGPLVGRAAEQQADEQTYPYSALLTSPTFIGSVVATFGAYWVVSLGLTWFTPFLVKGLGFSQKEAGLISIVPWILGSGITLVLSWVSQRLMARGVSSRGARAILGSAPLILGGVLFIAAPYFEGRVLILSALTLASCVCGLIFVVCPTMLGEFVPSRQRGAVLAIYGGLFSIAGVLSSVVMGGVVQQGATPLEGFLHGYQLNGVIILIAGIVGVLMLRPAGERARLLRKATPLREAT